MNEEITTCAVSALLSSTAEFTSSGDAFVYRHLSVCSYLREITRLIRTRFPVCISLRGGQENKGKIYFDNIRD